MLKPKDQLLFKNIEFRPGLLMGASRNPLTCLYVFLTGYAFGVEAAGGVEVNLIPSGFREFVATKLGVDAQMDVGSWYPWILESSANEEEAFRMFFKLLWEYCDNDSNEPSEPIEPADKKP